MGILNVTPDSFSDGGRYAALDAAVERARQIAAEGAAIIDIGGQSTRPGALAVEASVEIARVVPVIEAIAAGCDVAISIDTSKPSVMTAAVAAGACIINDVYALREPRARSVAAEAQAGVCLMHMQGEPRTMQDSPHYNDVVTEVMEFLDHERRECIEAGIASDAIALDPGFGFGKNLEHNLTLLRDLSRFAALDAPLLVGVSRKSVLGKILGKGVNDRLYGGLGLAALALANGARIIRTHDVTPTVDVVRSVSAVLQGMTT
ncbi:MAG TPA: dihydropteroate synthase [Steroidobacteraceae bacterium]|jgi:dihydropteroate synthase|nr:dihydropteroate synthase [Steroidobacteraceae bacterium]